MEASARKISFEEPEMKKKNEKTCGIDFLHCMVFDDISFLWQCFGDTVAMEFGVMHVEHFNTHAILQGTIIFLFWYILCQAKFYGSIFSTTAALQ